MAEFLFQKARRITGCKLKKIHSHEAEFSCLKRSGFENRLGRPVVRFLSGLSMTWAQSDSS